MSDLEALDFRGGVPFASSPGSRISVCRASVHLCCPDVEDNLRNAEAELDAAAGNVARYEASRCFGRSRTSCRSSISFQTWGDHDLRHCLVSTRIARTFDALRA